MYIENDVENDILMLRKKFNEIKKLKYVKGVKKGTAGIGVTFEHFIEKETDSLEIPDFGGVEIKTRRAYSKSLINLFNAVPTGSSVYEVKRLRDMYGYRDSKDYVLKKLNVEVNAKDYVSVGILYYFKLRLDIQKERVILEVYNKSMELVDESTYWDFDILKEKLIRKVSVLAVIKAWTKRKEGDEYFNFYKMNVYILKGFDNFIDALNDGVIKINLRIGNYYDEKRYGMVNSRGVGFSIAEDDLDKIYEYYR